MRRPRPGLRALIRENAIREGQGARSTTGHARERAKEGGFGRRHRRDRFSAVRERNFPILIEGRRQRRRLDRAAAVARYGHRANHINGRATSAGHSG